MVAPKNNCSARPSLQHATVVLLTVIAIGACTNEAPSPQATSYQAQGHYSEAASSLETLSTSHKLNLEEQKQLCESYLFLRRYDMIFKCIDDLEKLISLDGSGGPLSFPKPKDVTDLEKAAALLMRATALLDLGNFDDAVASADSALEYVNPVATASWTPLNLLLNGASLLKDRARVEKMHAHVLLAAIAYLEGKTTDGDRNLSEVLKLWDDVSWESMNSKLDKNVVPFEFGVADRPVASVYMAAKRYDKVLEELSGDVTAAERRDETWLVALGKGLVGALAIGGAIVTHSTAYVSQTADMLSQGLAAANIAANPYALEEALVPRTFMRAKAFLELGKRDEARPLYDRLLGFKPIPQDAAIYWIILLDRGRIAEGDGDAAGAISFYRRAIDALEQQRARAPTEASKIGFIGDKQEPYARLVRQLVLAGKIDEAFVYSERARSRALLDLLAGKGDFLEKITRDEAVARRLSTLTEAETGLESSELVPNMENQKRRAVVQNLTVELRHQAPEVASLVTVSASPLSDIQRTIAPDETWISYFLAGNQLIAFVISPTAIHAEVLDGNNLGSMTIQFLRALMDIQSASWTPLGQELYDRLIAPIRKHIHGRRLVIIPYGVLHYLPFAALWSGSDFLIDEYALRFLPSASVAQYIHRTPATPAGSLLVFGDPDLGNPALDLQYAREEARSIAALRPNTKLLLQGDATAAAFRSLSPEYRYIHYAGHAKFDTKVPFASALYLSPSPGDTGVLSLSDIYSLHLDADLVALSACKTGVSEVAGGDDIIGLTRGFLFAGARNVITTLWDVDDRATEQLMAQFYSAAPSVEFSEALRHAQEVTRRQFPQPFFWADFQLTGADGSFAKGLRTKKAAATAAKAAEGP